MNRPYHPQDGTAAPDPYRALIAAILARVVLDAQGQCNPTRGNGEQIQQEARAWLQDAQAVVSLLELAGYDPEGVLARIRHLAPSPGH